MAESKAAARLRAIELIALAKRPETDHSDWHVAIESHDTDSLVAALGGVGVGMGFERGQAQREAIRALIDQRLTERTVETMNRLERTSNRVARQGLCVAAISVLVTIAATYFGVKLALQGQAYLEASRERQQAVRVAQAAAAEANRSLAILAKRPSVDEWYSASGHQFELLLRKPLSSLNTLSQMPAFLSFCEPGGVSELLNLNVTLAWVPLPEFSTSVAAPTGIAQREAVPDPEAVLSWVKRASELLRECIRSLEEGRS